MGAVTRRIPEVAAPLPEAFFPARPSVALNNAVYGVRPLGGDGVGAATARYCLHFRIARTRANRRKLPPPGAQETLGAVVGHRARLGTGPFADTVLAERGAARRPDVWPAARVRRVARALRGLGVETLQDLGALRAQALGASLRAGFEVAVVVRLLGLCGGDGSALPDGAVRGFVSPARSGVQRSRPPGRRFFCAGPPAS